MEKEKKEEKEKKPGIKPGKGLNKRGCGRWIAYCGHQGHEGQKPITLSGTCACGRSFSVTCSSSTCTGRNFYC